jgi:hypothetical protein
MEAAEGKKEWNTSETLSLLYMMESLAWTLGLNLLIEVDWPFSEVELLRGLPP